MLKRIVMQASGQMARLFTIVYTQLMICLLKLVKKLHALIIQTFRNALTLIHPLAKTLPNFKAWVASQTTAAQSTKQEHSIAKAKVTPTGSQRQTIARPTRQRANPNQLQNKGFVAKIKLVQSLFKKAVVALTLIINQLKAIGLKQAGIVRQPQQPAQRQRLKGH